MNIIYTKDCHCPPFCTEKGLYKVDEIDDDLPLDADHPPPLNLERLEYVRVRCFLVLCLLPFERGLQERFLPDLLRNGIINKVDILFNFSCFFIFFFFNYFFIFFIFKYHIFNICSFKI